MYNNTTHTHGNAPLAGTGEALGKATDTRTLFPAHTSVKLSYPSMEFLPGRVLGRLLTRRRMTHKDSWLELGHARLADSIWKLRKLGWPVRIIEEVVPTSDAGRSASIGIYFLDDETIAAAGERGQQYAAECLRIERERRAS